MSIGLRIGDADRERAAADLAEHYAQGRLSVDEHAERLDAVWTARTAADLEPVFEDLPSLRAAPVTPAPVARSRSRSRSVPTWALPLLPLAAVLVVLGVVAHLPLILLGLAAFVLLRRHRGRHGSRHGARHGIRHAHHHGAWDCRTALPR